LRQLLREATIGDVEQSPDRVGLAGASPEAPCTIVPSTRTVAMQHPVFHVEHLVVVRSYQPATGDRTLSRMQPTIFATTRQELRTRWHDTEQFSFAVGLGGVRSPSPDEGYGRRRLNVSSGLTLFGERSAARVDRDVDSGVQRLMQTAVGSRLKIVLRVETIGRTVPARAVLHLADDLVALLRPASNMIRHVLSVFRMHDPRLHIAVHRHHFGGSRQFFHAS
jgi:hypothetical protein